VAPFPDFFGFGFTPELDVAGIAHSSGHAQLGQDPFLKRKPERDEPYDEVNVVHLFP
jgi:hypothetical protein